MRKVYSFNFLLAQYLPATNQGQKADDGCPSKLESRQHSISISARAFSENRRGVDVLIIHVFGKAAGTGMGKESQLQGEYSSCFIFFFPSNGWYAGVKRREYMARAKFS
jgi:hypothetical protein